MTFELAKKCCVLFRTVNPCNKDRPHFYCQNADVSTSQTTFPSCAFWYFPFTISFKSRFSSRPLICIKCLPARLRFLTFCPKASAYSAHSNMVQPNLDPWSWIFFQLKLNQIIQWKWNARSQSLELACSMKQTSALSLAFSVIDGPLNHFVPLYVCVSFFFVRKYIHN